MAVPLSMNDDSSPSHEHAATVRFTRRRHDFGRRRNPNVDSAWWPRSSNLATELPHLLQAAEDSGFRATRVAYGLDDAWLEPPPLPIAFGTRQVKVSGYHNHHRHMITLVDGVSHERLQIVVVPPETPQILATRALRIAAYHADPTSGADILALACGGRRAGVVLA
jgi:hypothetical protein